MGWTAQGFGFRLPVNKELSSAFILALEVIQPPKGSKATLSQDRLIGVQEVEASKIFRYSVHESGRVALRNGQGIYMPTHFSAEETVELYLHPPVYACMVWRLMKRGVSVWLIVTNETMMHIHSFLV